MIVGLYLCLQELKFVMIGVSYISSICTSVLQEFQIDNDKSQNNSKTISSSSQQRVD